MSPNIWATACWSISVIPRRMKRMPKMPCARRWRSSLAARLQSLAAPNTLVIDATTRRLAGETFEYEAVAAVELKGFAGLIAPWRVLRERTIASRFEALRAESRTPLVGREEEMELLLRRWHGLKDDEGRVVLLAGEPGIGKSRLTAALEDKLKDEAHVCLRYFCQPHHQGSALQPVIAQFQHAADFAPNDSRADKRAKIEALLAALPGEDADLAPILELLGLPDGGLDSVSDPQRGRRLLLNALIRRLAALAHKTPVLMLFEDM